MIGPISTRAIERSCFDNVVIDFFLTPDGPSGRRVRKYLAQHAPGLYRIAGPWSELMSQAHAAYLLPPTNLTFSEKLSECLAQSSDRFWSGSFEVAPEETTAELDAALNNLIEGAGPDADWSSLIKRLPQSFPSSYTYFSTSSFAETNRRASRFSANDGGSDRRQASATQTDTCLPSGQLS